MTCIDFNDPMNYAGLAARDWQRIKADTIDRLADLLTYPAVVLIPESGIESLEEVLRELRDEESGQMAVVR